MCQGLRSMSGADLKDSKDRSKLHHPLAADLLLFWGSNLVQTQQTQHGREMLLALEGLAHLPAQPCHVPCDDGHGHCKLLEYQAAVRITIRELTRGRKATQCLSIIPSHNKAVKSKCFNDFQCFNLMQFEGLCGKCGKDLMHIVNLCWFPSHMIHLQATGACQMNESSCTGRPLRSKISRLRAGAAVSKWEAHGSSMVSHSQLIIINAKKLMCPRRKLQAFPQLPLGT